MTGRPCWMCRQPIILTCRVVRDKRRGGTNRIERGDDMLVSDKSKMVLNRIVPTTPQQLVRLALTHARTWAAEGSVEALVFYALKRMEGIELNEKSRDLIKIELDSLLVEGYANAAWSCLEEARLVSAYTHVDETIGRMYEYLAQAELDADAWLDENGSSREGVEALREDGHRNRELNLDKAREDRRKRMGVGIPVTD